MPDFLASVAALSLACGLLGGSAVHLLTRGRLIDLAGRQILTDARQRRRIILRVTTLPDGEELICADNEQLYYIARYEGGKIELPVDGVLRIEVQAVREDDA